MPRLAVLLLTTLMAFPATAHAQKYTGQQIFVRYPSASAIGFATIPGNDPDGLSLAAVNRMIEGAIRGVQRREDGES